MRRGRRNRRADTIGGPLPGQGWRGDGGAAQAGAGGNGAGGGSAGAASGGGEAQGGGGGVARPQPIGIVSPTGAPGQPPTHHRRPNRPEPRAELLPKDPHCSYQIAGRERGAIYLLKCNELRDF